jgi:NAD(P)H-hydrate repair Nnr-like enzyme with NAD(P)H-hydrate dehydratase domain
MPQFVEWTQRDAARQVRVPTRSDGKYSRGVLGVVTGSRRYPGAAVLGVEGALRTGVGMVRYVGHQSVAALVLQRRPEAVLGGGRADAWLCGSGMDREELSIELLSIVRAAGELSQPIILDGGALDAHSMATTSAVVITPHHAELAGMFARWDGSTKAEAPSTADIGREPEVWATRAAELWGVTVLLKGFETLVVGPGVSLVARSATPWLATAGAGDALGGILGALVAAHTDQISSDPGALARLAATAAVIHGCAARRISQGGPFVILDLCAAIPATVAQLLETLGDAGDPVASDYS